MNNVYVIFEKLIRSINSYGNAPIGIMNVPIGAYFEQSTLLRRFDEIIQKNLLVNDFDAADSLTQNDSLGSISKELIEYLPLETRLESFILIYNKLFNTHTNDLIPGFKPLLTNLIKYFSISRYAFESIETFYKNQYFNDTCDSLYIVGPNHNPLCSANGAKVDHSGVDNKIVYLKVIPNYDLLLVKNISICKKYDQLTEDIEALSINLVNEEFFPELIKCKTKYRDVIKSISKPVTTNAIEVVQTESFPYIKLDPKNGQIMIEGVSTPISPLTYLEPILDWINLYCAQNKHLEINLAFKYYNTYTTKFLVRLINKCNVLNKKNSSILINWNYSQNDEELKESGEYYKELFSNKPEFQLVSILN